MEAVGLSRVLPVCVTGDTDGRLLVWDTATHTQLCACQHPEACLLICWESLHCFPLLRANNPHADRQPIGVIGKAPWPEGKAAYLLAI